MTSSSGYVQPPGQQSSITVGDILSILWRRLWIIALILGTSLGTAAYVTKHAPKRWKASAQMLLVQRAAPMVSSSTQSPVQGPIVDSTETQVAMLQSYAMASKTVTWLKNDALAKGKSPESVSVSAEELQKAITASAQKDTNLLDISVEAESRERAIDLTNAVCKAFVEWKREVAQENFLQTQSSLEQRLSRAKTELAGAESQELEFKKSHDMVDVTMQQGTLLKRAEELDSAVIVAQRDLAEQESHLRTAAARFRDAQKTIQASGASMRNDAGTMALQADLAGLKSKRAELMTRFNERHPDVIDVDKKIRELQAQLATAVRAAVSDNRPTLAGQAALQKEFADTDVLVRDARAKLAAAVTARDNARAALSGMPRANVEFMRLAQNTTNSRALYNNLQATLSMIRVNKDMEGGNVQIAQAAYAPILAFLPNHTRDLLFGAAIGLLLSLSAVLMLEQSDRKLRDVDSVRRIVPGPVIGALPRMSRADIAGMIAGSGPHPSDEAYTLARANLSLALPDLSAHQVIMVTSAVPGEGKSVTAANMARSIARSGRTVLLVDGDMRRPTQQLMFNTDEPFGLSDLLAGDKALGEVVVACDVPNLLLLPSGNATRNPTDLLTHTRLTETLEQLRQEAEVVIIDTPACSAVADALLIAPHADCILHVVGLGQSDEGTLRETIDVLRGASPRAMAFFVNRANGNLRSYAGGYYYGSYGQSGRSSRIPRLRA